MIQVFPSIKPVLLAKVDLLTANAGMCLVSSRATGSRLTSPVLLSISNSMSIKDARQANALIGFVCSMPSAFLLRPHVRLAIFDSLPIMDLRQANSVMGAV
jgi:hypothetical protein